MYNLIVARSDFGLLFDRFCRVRATLSPQVKRAHEQCREALGKDES